MPIATTDGCDPKHWLEVLDIIKGCCRAAGFTGDLVSDAADSGTILRRIVGNLYNSDMVIADVSGKNPNVMFELGMRLAFDKPAIVIKDDSTGYSFDTGVIEHISYPRDLHYPSMLIFQDKLTAKLTATFQASKDPQYTTFLKHFGEYTARKLETTEVSSNDLILKTLESFREEFDGLRYQISRSASRTAFPARENLAEPVGALLERDFVTAIASLATKYLRIREINGVKSPIDIESFERYLLEALPQFEELPPKMRAPLIRNALRGVR